MRTITLLVALLALAGCGLVGGGDSVRVESHAALEDELAELRAQGSHTVPLRELIPGEWDTMVSLLGPTTKDRVEREVGQSVELRGVGTWDGDTYMQEGNLLVLMNGDEIIQMIGLTYNAFGAGRSTSSTVVEIDADGRTRLVEPSE